MKKDHEHLSPKLAKSSKTRSISSRFLSPGLQTPNQTTSPLKRTTSSKQHRSCEENGLIRGLWPSSNTTSSVESSSNKKVGTLADHLGNDRLNEFLDRNMDGPQLLGRQRSCSQFSRFEKEKEKENNHPIVGGSMRYTEKLRFPGKSSKNSSSSGISAGRLSIDESSLMSRRLSSRRDSDSFLETMSSESECSTDTVTSSIGRSSNHSFRKSGIEVSSRYLKDPLTKLRRGTSDSNIPTPVSDNSTSLIPLPPKVKRASSLKAVSQWALSPGRSGSPPMSVESKGKPIMTFSNLRPPNSSSRSKGVGNLLSIGLDLFKSKKSSTNSLATPLAQGVGEDAHQLRLLHNRLLQWRYANARGVAVNGNKTVQTENNLANAWTNLSKLQSSVVAKRIQFRKQKRDYKLNNIVGSQFKSLQSWGDMERQHLSAISTTKDCLHSVVCRVPLSEGAKVDTQKTSLALRLRHASDLTASIRTMLIDFSPSAQRTSELLLELSTVVAREKLLLEECFELLGTVSGLEIQEKNLRCSIIQLRSKQEEVDQGRVDD